MKREKKIKQLTQKTEIVHLDPSAPQHRSPAEVQLSSTHLAEKEKIWDHILSILINYSI